jgi:hypothetical protein
MSVRFSAWNISASTGRSFIKLYICVFCEKLSRNFKFHYNRTRITGTLHDNQYTFLVISRLIPFRVENVSDKCCRENDNILCSITFSLNRAVYEIMWKSIRERDGPQMTIWRMRIECWIPKATNTHRGSLMLIAFPLQQWLHERASMLRYTYIACLVCFLHPFTAGRNE